MSQAQFLPMQGAAYVPSYDPGAQQLLRVSPAPPSRDHVLCSLFSFIYCNPFCLGLVALYYSIRARDRKVLGDLEAARELGSKARIFNMVALGITMASVIVSLIVWVILVFGARRYYY